MAGTGGDNKRLPVSAFEAIWRSPTRTSQGAPGRTKLDQEAAVRSKAAGLGKWG
jgi:hypothetical protein